MKTDCILSTADFDALRDAKYHLSASGTGLVRLPNPDCTVETALHFEPAQALHDFGLGELVDRFVALSARADAISVYIDAIDHIHGPEVMGVRALQDTTEANELYGRLVALRNAANAARDTLITAIERLLVDDARHPDTFVLA